MRPPTAASMLCILACMALSEATSNRPRPRPDWLVATTTCQPAWLSRAMASSAPGNGSHSDGDLTKSALSSLIVPSRSRMTSFISSLFSEISLPPGRYGGDEVQRLFTNTLDWDAHPCFQEIKGLEVSSHFYIRRGGELWQFASCDARAWHAGTSHYRGRDNCNDDSVGIELEGLEGEPFEAVQYVALAGLLADLCARFPITGITGHSDVAPGRKTDPGPWFSWMRLRRLLTDAGHGEVACQVEPEGRAGGDEGALMHWPFPVGARPA